MHQPNTAASSSRRAAASRANGALSRGPVTQAGKARSSQNARTHGFTAAYSPAPAATDVLTHLESAANFQAHAARYFDYFQPTNAVEYDLVERLVVSKWQIDRIIVARAAAISLEAIDTAHEVKKKYESISPDGQLALAIKSLDEKSNILTNLSRYESRHVRDYDKALNLLNYNPEPLTPLLPEDDLSDDEQNASNHPQTPAGGVDGNPQVAMTTKTAEPEPQPHPSIILSLMLALQFLWLFPNHAGTGLVAALNPLPVLQALLQWPCLLPIPSHQSSPIKPTWNTGTACPGWPFAPALNRS